MSSSPDPNRAFALTLVDELARAGLTDACLAPGSRSAPLALALAEDPRVRVHVHVDERSAGFFALGLAKASGRPVALLSTSGTAAANFHPAVVEAHHARAPLVVLTADRPPRLRDTGAGQAIDQVKLYGAAVRWFCEAGVPAGGPEAGTWWRSLAARAWAMASGTGGTPPGPVHLNLAFDEPLVPAELGGEPAPGRPGGQPWVTSTAAVTPPPAGAVAALAAAVRSSERGLLVAGWGAGLDPEVAGAFAAAAGWPVLADPLSGLRRGPHAIAAYDALLRVPAFADAHRPDLVVRVGAAPTGKVLPAWLDASVPQVLVDPEGGWQDPHRAAAQRLPADPSALLAAVTAALRGHQPSGEWLARWQRADALAREAASELLDAWEEPFEGRVARDLVAHLPEGATLVVASSMPVRDVEAFAPPRDGLRFLANRGANGIDGFVATTLGVAAAGGGPVVGLCGDLAFLHDASSVLGAARQAARATFVVLDNDGGGIFSFLPQARLPERLFEPLFGTPHGLDLCAVAAAAGLPTERVTRAADLLPALDKALEQDRTAVLVVAGDRAANAARHRAVHEAVARAVERA